MITTRDRRLLLFLLSASMFACSSSEPSARLVADAGSSATDGTSVSPSDQGGSVLLDAQLSDMASGSSSDAGVSVADSGTMVADSGTTVADAATGSDASAVDIPAYDYRATVDLTADGTSYNYTVLTVHYQDAQLGVTCDRDVFYYVPRSASATLRAITVIDSAQGVTMETPRNNPQELLGVSATADDLRNILIIQLQGTKISGSSCTGMQADDALGIETGFVWNHYPNIPDSGADDVNFVIQAAAVVRDDVRKRFPGHEMIDEGLNIIGHSNGMMMGATVTYLRPERVRRAVFYKFGDFGAYNINWCASPVCPGDISNECLNDARNVLTCVGQNPAIVKLTNQVPIVLVDEDGMDWIATPPCRATAPDYECAKIKSVQSAERLARLKANFGVAGDGTYKDYTVRNELDVPVTLRLYTPVDAQGSPIADFRFGLEVGVSHQRIRGTFDKLIRDWLASSSL